MNNSAYRDYAKDFEELGLAPLYQKTFEELTLEEKRRVLCFEAEKQDEFNFLPKMQISDTIPIWVKICEHGFISWIMLPILFIFLAHVLLPIDILKSTELWAVILLFFFYAKKFIWAQFIKFFLRKYQISLTYGVYKNKFYLYRLWKCYSGKERWFLKYMWFSDCLIIAILFLAIFLFFQSLVK